MILPGAGVDLPTRVLAAAAEHTGQVVRSEPLGGLSERTVVLLHGDRGSVVVKGPAPPAELAVARWPGGFLGQHGVTTPQVLRVVDTTGSGSWVVMEHLPRALPRERWGADEHVVAVLRALHTVPTHLVASLPGRYRPAWDDALTAAATSALGADSTLRDRLMALCESAQRLFDPQCVVSADPNPLNWRLDEQDRPVLLDLERITLGTPALDLAIALPGLPDRASAAAMGAAYGAGAPSVDDILLAKVWSVVEFAAQAAADTRAQQAIADLLDAFPYWLDQLDDHPTAPSGREAGARHTGAVEHNNPSPRPAADPPDPEHSPTEPEGHRHAHPVPEEPVEMTREDFENAVGDALDEVPHELMDLLDNVVFFVEDEPPPEDPDLLGVYDGIPLTERGDSWGGQMPDRITIFRGPTLRMCHDRAEVIEEIAITVVHEIAHHFGIDDEKLHALGWG